MLLRTTFASNISKKVIVSMNCDYEINESQKNVHWDTYQCHPDHLYVIFGKKQ